MKTETLTKPENVADGLEMKLKDKAAEYKKWKNEIVAEEERISKMQDQLEHVQTILEAYEEDVYEAKKEKSNGGFSSVDDVIRVRKKLEEAEAGYQDQCSLMADVQQEIKRTSSKVQGIQRDLNNRSKGIFRILAEQKADEIRAAAGELFKEFIAAATVVNNNCHPFSGGRVPGYLSFITGEGSNSIGLADKMLEDVLSDT